MEGASHLQSLGLSAEPIIPGSLGEYFAFCKAYYKEHKYRGNLVSGASRLHQDRGSLFSLSYCGPMITLEPSSTGEKGWDDFLIDFNDFASAAGGTPSFNQTRALQPEHVAKSFGERVKLFQARCASAPIRSIGCETAISPICWGSGSQTGNDLCLDGFEFGIADEFGVEHFARLAQAPGRFRFRAGGIRARIA